MGQLRPGDRRGKARPDLRQQRDLHDVRDRAVRAPRHGSRVCPGAKPHQAQSPALSVPGDRDRHARQLRHPDEGDAGDAPGEHAGGDGHPVRRVQAALRRVRDLRVPPHRAGRDRRGGDPRRMCAAPALLADHGAPAAAGLDHGGDLDVPRPVERVHHAALLPQQIRQVADDARGLQLLRHLRVELEPGVRRCRADDPARARGLRVRPALHQVRDDRRRGQGVTTTASTGEPAVGSTPGPGRSRLSAVNKSVTAAAGERTNFELYAALLQGRMRGDDALEASQQLLQVLMDSSANAVFWKDCQSRYLGCNRVFAAFAGTEPDDLIGKSDRDMPWADDDEFGADWFIDWDAHVAETGEPAAGIVERLRRASGDLRWIETQKVPLRDLDGEVIGILGTFEDVTERRAAEERLNGTLKDLDKRVQQRTRDLERAIESLRREVDDRVRVQAEERQQRAYAEALRDTASAMSKTLDVQEVLEQVLIGVERLVSNDLTAIVLVDGDESLSIARGRVG